MNYQVFKNKLLHGLQRSPETSPTALVVASITQATNGDLKEGSVFNPMRVQLRSCGPKAHSLG